MFKKRQKNQTRVTLCCAVRELLAEHIQCQELFDIAVQVFCVPDI